MNDNLTESVDWKFLFLGTKQETINRKMKALRRMMQDLADEMTVRDAAASMEQLREEEEGLAD